ncbi:hypothetical protein CH92_13460 [Stutzerimonas stutzeri]|uniref:Uncharacterized protein n=1 Tax=Stutzerimonas stutzeri TaxID=316 RepID=W8RC82_STUST|nr:hypothetical protein [Stutzerimonas stutzeri]AHL76047.1 hypothetical protein CH92_13460 [Stutzerimonas stutzeri]MCQ4330601.1 hypothetical protein [Stutzerimonas stutzeri]
MRTYLLIALGSVAGLVAGTGVAATPVDSATIQLAQNTGAADRSLGNGSMGLGEGIERLPERREADRNEREDQRRSKAHSESGHGDNDIDMEHHPRRTLGNQNDD